MHHNQKINTHHPSSFRWDIQLNLSNALFNLIHAKHFQKGGIGHVYRGHITSYFNTIVSVGKLGTKWK